MVENNRRTCNVRERTVRKYSECNATEAKHMTRILRHLELAQLWFKEKVADETCIIEKVDSEENNSDIGAKRVPKFIFDYLTHKLVDKSLGTNI